MIQYLGLLHHTQNSNAVIRFANNHRNNSQRHRQSVFEIFCQENCRDLSWQSLRIRHDWMEETTNEIIVFPCSHAFGGQHIEPVVHKSVTNTLQKMEAIQSKFLRAMVHGHCWLQAWTWGSYWIVCQSRLCQLKYWLKLILARKISVQFTSCYLMLYTVVRATFLNE